MPLEKRKKEKKTTINSTNKTKRELKIFGFWIICKSINNRQTDRQQQQQQQI